MVYVFNYTNEYYELLAIEDGTNLLIYNTQKIEKKELKYHKGVSSIQKSIYN